MPTSEPTDRIVANRSGYDAVIVGASLSGSATAILLGRAGARVALIDKQPDPSAYKRICSHYIQAGAVPSFERLGLLEDIIAAGGLRSRINGWTDWGWVESPDEEAAAGLNLRRELLDPLVREAAAATPGVELMLGRTADRLLREDDRIGGIVARDRDGGEIELRAPLTVGADGRDSTIAELSGVPVKTHPHGRIAYGGYFEGADPATAPDASFWMLDPQWAAGFPTDSGLTFYAAMATKDRLPDFKRDPEGALVSYIADLPEAPPIREGRLVGPVLGKVDMLNRVRRPTAPGLALVGDAALATDPLFGVGCGWAVQSGEWLADSVAPALQGAETLERGLARYRRRHRRELRGHAFFIHDYANGRRMRASERMMFAAAASDAKTAALFNEMGTRRVKPMRGFARVLPRLVAARVRHAVAR
jgi:flavin-dependent dehydrogenase